MQDGLHGQTNGRADVTSNLPLKYYFLIPALFLSVPGDLPAISRRVPRSILRSCTK